MPLLDGYLLEYKKNNISIQYLIKEYCKNRTSYDTKILQKLSEGRPEIT